MSNYKNKHSDNSYTGFPSRSPDPPSFEQMSTIGNNRSSNVAPALGQRTNHGYQHRSPSYLGQQAQLYQSLISRELNGRIEGYSYVSPAHRNVAGNNYHIMQIQQQNHMQLLQSQQQKHHVYYQPRHVQNDTHDMSGNASQMNQSNNDQNRYTQSNLHHSENGQIQDRSQSSHGQQNIQQYKESHQEQILGNLIANYTISIISLSTSPLSGTDILNIVERRTKEVETLYLPCVDFLVICQQELRHALTAATLKNGRKMTTSKFYHQFFQPLPQRFYDRFHAVMDTQKMNDAYIGIQSLLLGVKKEESSGKHENMKNAFLGGMRDGESWGLRKWMSKHGGALKICNDLELIWTAFRNMKDPEPAVIELARLFRPLAQVSFDKLRKQIPKAYQERSTAHPYLPFFHRLESVLQGLSEFDPEDDDVICLDDVEDNTTNFKAETANSMTLSSQAHREEVLQSVYTSAHTEQKTDLRPNEVGQTFNSICDSDIEIIETKQSKQLNTENFATDSEQTDRMIHRSQFNSASDYSQNFPCTGKKYTENVQELAALIESIASSLELGQEVRPHSLTTDDDFWSTIANYVGILRLFRNLIVHKSSAYFIDITSLSNGDNNEIIRYCNLIKRPLFFRDIAAAMRSDGRLTVPALNKWNMFRGEYLIQAVDLVFLNALAFVGREADLRRREIDSMRQMFWKEIRDMSREKKHIPIQRRETSEFIIRKTK